MFQIEKTEFSAQIERFLEHTYKRAKEHNVSIIISPNSRIPYIENEAMMVSGYFIDRPKLELAVAAGKPFEEWLPILVHESCHMDQWIENTSVWKNVFVQGREAVDWIDLWLNGEENLPEPIENLIQRTREVELDCEQRSLRKIQEFGLPIDMETYAKRANSYVYYYNHLLKTRKWYPENNVPYENERIWSQAPSHCNNTGSTPKELEKAFLQEYPV